jgi:hypothetical protein
LRAAFTLRVSLTVTDHAFSVSRAACADTKQVRCARCGGILSMQEGHC